MIDEQKDFGLFLRVKAVSRPYPANLGLLHTPSIIYIAVKGREASATCTSTHYRRDLGLALLEGTIHCSPLNCYRTFIWLLA
jgi:hypothetical protein